MVKKLSAALAVVLAFGLVIFVEPVRTFALEAMSVFRVSEAKTLRISINDIEFMRAALAELDENDMGERPSPFIPLEERKPQRANGTWEDFGAFDVKLPKAWKSDEATRYYTQTEGYASVALQAGAFNELLVSMGGYEALADEADGAVLTLRTPAVLWAERDGMIFAATQTPYLEGDRRVKEALKDGFLSLPVVSPGLRGQLALIDVDSRDVYLPVLEGFGRDVRIHDTAGTLYASADFLSAMGSLYRDADDEITAFRREDMPMSALVWVRGGVLYVLMGDVSDAELTALAETVR